MSIKQKNMKFYSRRMIKNNPNFPKETANITNNWTMWQVKSQREFDKRIKT